MLPLAQQPHPPRTNEPLCRGSNHWNVSGFLDNALYISHAGICTPVRWAAWESVLDGYEDRDYIVEGFRHGFHIGVQPADVRMRCHLPKSTTVDPALRRKLNSELAAGRVLGPYDTVPIFDLQVSPLYVIPKKEQGKFRMIHDLSRPKGWSVNDNILPEMSTVQYCSVADVVDHIQRNGSGDYHMIKIDMKDAYRSAPINKQDWRYLGMTIGDKYFVDRCLPMGLSSSCHIYQRISDALAWVFKQDSSAVYIANYLDDFLLLTTSKRDSESLLQEVLEKCDFLGVPVNAEKTEHPTKSLIFLGVGIDLERMVLFIPETRRLEMIEAIDVFCGKKCQTVLSFQQLIGKLNFLCQIILPGRTFLRSTIGQLSGVLSSNKYASRRVTKDVVMDLMVWRSFLTAAMAKPFKFVAFDGPADFTLVTDASGAIGYGGYMADQWFNGVWEDAWWSNQNICLLELYPIFAALHMWKDKLTGKVVLIRTDNEALVSILRALYSREPLLNKLLKKVALCSLENNIVLRSTHIRGADNSWADKLSRRVYCPEIQNNPSMSQAHIPDYCETEKTKNDLM